MTIHQRKGPTGGKDDQMRGWGAYKGVTVQEIADFFTKADAFPGVLEWTSFEKLENGDELIYYRVKAPLCDERDNILKMHIDKRDDGSIFICMRSWDHSKYPVQKKPLRINYLNQTYIWPSKEEEGVVELTEFILLELGGSLSGMTNGMLGKETIKTNKAMMDVLKKN